MLAPNYFNWPGKVWIFSDPHFGDSGILRYERTQFQNSDEHNEFILKIINRTVQSNDTLVCLGDLGQKWEDAITKIKPCGKKILVMGNHDHDNKTKYKKYFDEVYPGPLFVNKFTILSHEPIPVSDHFVNIHGHLHNSYLDDDHHVNASIAMADYKLIPLDMIYDKVQDYPRIRAEFLEEWYADKYVFTDSRKDCLMYADTMHVIPRKKIEFFIDLVTNTKYLDWGLTEEEKQSFKEYYSHKLFKNQKMPNIKTTDDNIIVGQEMIRVWRENEF